MLAKSPVYRGRPTRSGVHRLDERVHAAASLELRDGLVILGAYHVTVRPMEYKVLEYLLAHAGTVVSSDELIVAIWKEPNTPSALDEFRGRLSTTMNRLRKALGASSALIETVRGGYLVRSARAGDQGMPSLRVDVRRL
ncbi:MAG TPA: winged helix-turn-helix domain-containing protein [Polyangiaceae bacterium]